VCRVARNLERLPSNPSEVPRKVGFHGPIRICLEREPDRLTGEDGPRALGDSFCRSGKQTVNEAKAKNCPWYRLNTRVARRYPAALRDGPWRD
jgi:hypothetical protein